MPVSRRRLLSAAVSAGAAHAVWPSWISARGREGLVGQAASAPPRSADLFLDSNENPTGPCPAAADALSGLLAKASRYPMRDMRALADDIAGRHATRADYVSIGCGSTEILINAVRTFTSPTAALVAPTPTFESPARLAQTLGHPVVERPVTAALAVDLDDLARHVKGAGLVFLCNPNNPTGTALPLDAVTAFVRDTRKRSPETVVLLDEAYIEYADGQGVASAEGLALSMPNVIVSRRRSAWPACGWAMRSGHLPCWTGCSRTRCRWASTCSACTPRALPSAWTGSRHESARATPTSAASSRARSPRPGAASRRRTPTS
jgi:histidinol-phosphate aminotransferase